MIPCAFLTVLIWPKVQMGIGAMQGFMKASGVFGVWVYTFLERILIPTGLHHFVYTPFILDQQQFLMVIQVYWVEHIKEFAQKYTIIEIFISARWICVTWKLKNIWCSRDSSCYVCYSKT